MGLLSRTRHGYKSGARLVPIRWVFVRDRDGTHRDAFFFRTDPARWHLETTFQERRALLGLETTRGWSRKTVLRVAPCLFGHDTAVALIDHRLPESKRAGRVEWPGKAGVTFSDALMGVRRPIAAVDQAGGLQEVTFSDALMGVRRWLWREWVFPQAGVASVVQKLPESVQDLLLYGLAPAA